MNLLGHLAADAGYFSKLLHACRQHPGNAAKTGDEGLAPSRPDTGQTFQRRRLARLTALGAMAGDGETVRLITHFLDQVQSRMVGRQVERRPAVSFGKDQTLLDLRPLFPTFLGLFHEALDDRVDSEERARLAGDRAAE